MEFGRAWILTHGLGSLSSLGKAGRYRLAAHGGWKLELNGKSVDVMLEAGRVFVRPGEALLSQSVVEARLPRAGGSVDPSPTRDPGARVDQRTAALQALLPGRIILSTYKASRAVALTVDEGRLVADIGATDGPLLIALELTQNGRSFRTRPILIDGAERR